MKIVDIVVKKVYRFNCPNCQSRLEADSSELTDIGVLQTKVNRKNEKSPAKFTRPKMGITKQAGEKSHRQPG